MVPNPRVMKAFNAMKALGISAEEVKPVLAELLRVYDKNWELIEEDNYRTLVDAYFEFKEDKGRRGKEKAPFNCHAGETPRQKLRVIDEAERDLFTMDNSNQKLSRKVVKDRKTYPEKASSAGHCDESEQEPLKPRIKKPKLQMRPVSTNYDGLSEPSNGVNRGVKSLATLNQIIQSKDASPSCNNNTTTGNCLSLSLPCACARETGGEFAYTPQGLLKEEFLAACLSMKNQPQDHHFVYCQECPVEKSKNGYMPEQCKGHMLRKFIKECWRKCGCDMRCGNRVVQRGIRCKLQVFMTREGKGWGLRPLEDLPKGTFVCEYAGEILTNTELYERNMETSGNERHTYPVTLDADWGSEGVLKDEEALCLDATYNGNVGRFINHRCFDANLIDIPVEVETPDHHYYHLAFFTNRNVKAYEELTWDYGIDFDDLDHPIKAFQCCCGSAFCCDKKGKGKRKVENQVHVTTEMYELRTN